MKIQVHSGCFPRWDIRHSAVVLEHPSRETVHDLLARNDRRLPRYPRTPRYQSLLPSDRRPLEAHHAPTPDGNPPSLDHVAHQLADFPPDGPPVDAHPADSHPADLRRGVVPLTHGPQNDPRFDHLTDPPDALQIDLQIDLQIAPRADCLDVAPADALNAPLAGAVNAAGPGPADADALRAPENASDPLRPMNMPGRSFLGALDARLFEEQSEVRTWTTDVLRKPVEWTGEVTELLDTIQPLSGFRFTGICWKLRSAKPPRKWTRAFGRGWLAQKKNGSSTEPFVV